jgi:hypothetical protein
MLRGSSTEAAQSLLEGTLESEYDWEDRLTMREDGSDGIPLTSWDGSVTDEVVWAPDRAYHPSWYV